jgi:steroid delta-isomerase-like uncharacterized protein
MPTSVETVRAWSDHFNSRDWQSYLSLLSPDAEFVDLAQGVTAKGHDAVLAYAKGWVDAFSDGAYSEHRLRPADGAVVFQFLAVGTNDGPFGSFAASGKRVAFPGMNVIELNDKGQISRIEQLYDRLDILTQLGHITPS